MTREVDAMQAYVAASGVQAVCTDGLGDVLPRLAQHYLPNWTGVHPVPSGEGVITPLAGGMQHSNSPDGVFAENSAFVHAANREPTLDVHIPVVVEPGSDEQVLWSNARRSIAFVEYAGSGDRDGSEMEDPGNLMRQPYRAGPRRVAKRAVAPGVSCTSPYPAGSKLWAHDGSMLVDTSPEAILNGAALRLMGNRNSRSRVTLVTPARVMRSTPASRVNLCFASRNRADTFTHNGLLSRSFTPRNVDGVAGAICPQVSRTGVR